jgi:hypothetical protein
MIRLTGKKEQTVCLPRNKQAGCFQTVFTFNICRPYFLKARGTLPKLPFRSIMTNSALNSKILGIMSQPHLLDKDS